MSVHPDTKSRDRCHKTHPNWPRHGGGRLTRGVKSFSFVECNLVLGMCYRKYGLVDSIGTLSLEWNVLCELVFTQWRMRKWFMKQLNLRCVVLTGYTAQNEETQRMLGWGEGSKYGNKRSIGWILVIIELFSILTMVIDTQAYMVMLYKTKYTHTNEYKQNGKSE